ncbi:MAG TPA: formate dehydrogenase subunit delta [Pusillimonas sp.]|uniref:formate dehydrogenase subunit delta n=1 Tax=Pusillimonas sp. TaxID=3040095 RepID=UPI002B8E8929|nr:formate dehydrogenase subunit delta [Pusillimonas sp.]HUH86595.1 formate dehydrogenase subunit delta [Pusillimonas sp.]
MNNIDHLIQMANSIGDFFEALPDRQEGIHGIADHIKKFWEPRMRTAMLEFLDQHPDGRTQDAELSEMVREAIVSNREMLLPKVVS